MELLEAAFRQVSQCIGVACPDAGGYRGTEIFDTAAFAFLCFVLNLGTFLTTTAFASAMVLFSMVTLPNTFAPHNIFTLSLIICTTGSFVIYNRFLLFIR